MSVTPSSGRAPTAPTPSPRTIPSQLVTPALLVMATPPCLLAIVVLRAIGESLEQVGLTSEEIFRGDRLPVIPFPVDIS